MTQPETCENCAAIAEQNHALQQRAVAEHEKREALTNQIVDLTRKNGRLKGELTKLQSAEVPSAEVKFVFDRWASAQPGNPKLGPKRSELIARALGAKWGGRERVLRAIRGASRYPYVVNAQRRGQGKREQRHDGLELILRDETTLEKFCKLARQADLYDGVVKPGRVPDIVASFDAEQISDPYSDELIVLDDPFAREWWVPCPNHGASHWTEAPMRVTWGDEGKPELRCLKGCSAEQIAAGLAERDEPEQMGLLAA
jgi:hypothetical protein